MKCPCCQSEQLEKRDYDFYFCSSCDHLFRVSEAEVVYQELENRNFETQVYHDRILSRIEYIQHLEPEVNSMIDIGCSEGLLASKAQEILNLEKVEGVEVSKDREIAQRRLDNVYDNIFNVDGQYDLVSSFHVLEHIKDIHPFLQKMVELSNRYLYLEVPLGSGNEKLEYDLNPEHFHFFSYASFSKLLQSYGVEILKMESGFVENARYKNSLRVILKKKVERMNLSRVLKEKVGNSFIVYGLGGDFKNVVLPYLDQQMKIQYADSSLKEFGGEKILSLDELKLSSERILICSIRFGEEIFNQLKKENIDSDRIIKIETLLL
jgi:hypothetical protein